MIRHQVIEGDSLWRLSHRYLGSGTRWSLIFDYHNTEAARFGAHSRLMPIEDANLIYVSQTIMVPVRTKQMPSGTGKKTDGDKVAVPLNLKVEYTIGKDTPPIVYTLSAPDFTIKTEITGKITVEVLGSERCNHNFELALGKDPIQIKSRLRLVYDPAICALTAEPEISYESGLIKIKAPIAAEYNPGTYMIRVEAVAPNHLSGFLSVQPFGGKLMAGGRRYKYYAEIEYGAEMIWHPKPNGKTEDVARSESAGARNVYLVDSEGKPEDQAISTFHHEFSSLLLSGHSFYLNPWTNLNPYNFKYIFDKSKETLELYKEVSLNSSDEDYEKGYMNSYGQTSFENDFNEYSAMILTCPSKLEKIMRKYPRVRAKFLVWQEFYQKIDPIFTEAYFFGGS
jgi:hypothetical protein